MTLIEDKLFTIGYSNFYIEDFVRLLHDYGINYVADVRSIPYSTRHRDYNKDLLKARLKPENIEYHNFKNEFGARQSDERFYSEGYLDFKKFSESEQFLSGVEEIEQIINSGYKVVFMCTEKEPENCHRCIMVARYFYEHGYEIKHILDENEEVMQNNVESFLIKKFFLQQISLIDNNYSDEEMIAKSYELQNEEIGYRLNNRGNSNEDFIHNWVYEKDSGRIFHSA